MACLPYMRPIVKINKFLTKQFMTFYRKNGQIDLSIVIFIILTFIYMIQTQLTEIPIPESH